MLLEVRQLGVRYGGATALDRVSLSVDDGEAVCVIGPNGAGKTTLLRAISGLVPATSGTIHVAGADVGSTPTRLLAKLGVAHVPEARRILAALSVLDNLRLGAYLRNDADGVQADLEKVYGYFPVLRARGKQSGGTLSGGEQQMLAIGRALMMRPRLLLLDEPSLGIAPTIVAQIYRDLKDIVARERMAVVLVEQNARVAFSLAKRGYVLAQGRVALEGSVGELARDPAVAEAYVGKTAHA
ncbi:ABC transporter ATP-binding protein [Ramlibacter sp.]|uniref:ABC transporter ATP-binding protein n=1 Tax=Ramlibacter sp. TaxID=1917967 RepID=UPI003D0BC63A